MTIPVFKKSFQNTKCKINFEKGYQNLFSQNTYVIQNTVPWAKNYHVFKYFLDLGKDKK